MREILFRAKTKETGEWKYGFVAKNKYYSETEWVFVIEDEEGYWLYGAEVIPETIGQFTGLIDKNGNKIFEGDIVKATYDYGPAGEIERIVEVVLDPFGTNLQAWIFKGDGYLPEIIGNIHDNPELLEGGIC